MSEELIQNISVDCVVFGFNPEEKSLSLLLIERKLEALELYDININDHKLTGFHVQKKETLDEAASRVMRDLTGLDNIFKKQFKIFGDPDRINKPHDVLWIKSQNLDSRSLTVAYSFLIPVNAVDLEGKQFNPKWFPINEIPTLAFDHKQIVDEAYADLKKKALHDPMIFELLPEKFTLNELQDLYETVLGLELDSRNFRRKVLTKKYIVKLTEKRVGQTKKPSQLFTFNLEIFEKLSEENRLINL